MSRSLLVPILAAALILSLPHFAQAAGRCPFNGHAQITIWVQMQQQVQQQQQQVARQQQHAARVNPIPGRAANVPISRQTAGRNNGASAPGRRSTATSSTTTVRRSQSTQTIRRSTVERSAWAERPVGHGPGAVRSGTATRRTESTKRITRTTLHPTTAARRSSEEQRGIHRPPQEWKRQSDACRHIEAPTRTAPAKRNDARATRKTVQSVHPATVWVRITVNVRCGGCHRCGGNPTQKGGQPADPIQVARKPRMPFQQGKEPDRVLQQGKEPRMPFQQGKKPERDLQIARPEMPFQQGADKPLDRHVRRPDPEQPFMVRPARPALKPIARVDRPVPDRQILRPPALPPLAGVVRPGSGRPIPGWMVPSKIETTPQPATTEQPAPDQTASLLPQGTQPVTTLDPPALPALSGSVVQLNPILGAKQSGSSESEDNRRELLPSDVVEAPVLPPLPGKHAADRGLLPTLDRDERSERDAFDPSGRPSALDLVLQPPALPEVVSR